MAASPAPAHGVKVSLLHLPSAIPASSFVRMPLAKRSVSSFKLHHLTKELHYPPRMSNGVSRRAEAVENLTVYSTVPTEFNANIEIGTPSQTLRVLFDTGSYLVWVKSSACTTVSCVGGPVFNSGASSTFSVVNNVPNGISYVDGTNITGMNVQDTVTLGNGVTLPQFEFVAAQSLVSFNPRGDLDSDGIIGMSLTPTFAVNPLLFTSLIAANAVSAPQMSYSLNPSDASGEIVFGGYDTTLFADPAAPLLFSTVAPSSLGSFALALSSITTDSTLIPNVTTTFSAAAIIDTGTSFATVPTNILTPLAAAVNATFSPTYGVYIAPCSSQDVNAGPILSYNFASGVTVYATAAEYVIHPPAAVGLQGCILALTPINDASSTFYVGNTVLKRWVTVFDYANGGRVGFALAKGRAIKGAVATTTTMTATTALATAPATSVSVMPPALPTASATNPAAATAAAQSGSTGSSGTPLVAVILAPLLIVLALALAIFLCIRYRRRQPSSFATFKRRGSDDVFASAGLMEGRVVYIGDAESPAAGKQDVGGAVRIDGTKRMNEYDVGAAGGGGVLAVAASAGNTPEPLAPVRRDSAGAPLLVNTEAPASQPALDGVRSEAIVAPPRGDSAKSPLPEPEVETSVQVAGGETTAVLSPGLTEPMSAATEPMGSSSLVLGPLGIVEEEEKVDKVQ